METETTTTKTSMNKSNKSNTNQEQQSSGFKQILMFVVLLTFDILKLYDIFHAQ
jgi:hypothetical protein